MNFHTQVNIPEFGFILSHKTECFLTGSCFATNIGEKLKENKIPGLHNPTGILYNPLSIANSLETALSGRTIKENELFLYEGVWNHFDFHSSFSSQDKVKCIKNISEALSDSSKSLKTADYIFVSFGTAYAYFLKKNGKIVANCHKQLPATFDRKLLSVNEITKNWSYLINKISQTNPKAKIIFTVSPIRHWKDGATNNQFSKASLFLAIKELTENNPDKVFYFPAYEILQDELRDYRFYDSDMLHPSKTAIEYIWEKFGEAFFDKDTLEINKRMQKIKRACNHRPFNPETTEYSSFCKKMISEIQSILTHHKNLDFTEELKYFNSTLQSK
jgi:lysophospholipase L1-like esterase